MYLAVAGICIHTEGFLLLVNKVNGLIHVFYCQNRKNWTKEILLHDGILLGYLCQNRRGFGERKENRTAVNLMHKTVGFVSENPTHRPLTDVLLCFYHLSAHSHLSRSPQHVSRAVEELWIDHAAIAAGLSGIRTVELRQAALEGLHQPCLDIRVAQDVARSRQALSSIVKTCPGDALCGGGNVALLVHITRVLATQNQGDGCECASRSLSNSAALLSVPYGMTDVFNNKG